jgi:CBS-domain-containing membrane protein
VLESALKMLVRDYMSRNVTTLSAEAPLLDAALLIRRTGKRHVPVVDAAGKVVGIISDRDVYRLQPSVLEEHTQEDYNQVFENTPLERVMTRNVVSTRPDAPLLEAVQEMYSKKISALVVLEGEALVGIITSTDMLGVLVEMLGGSRNSEAAAG